MTRVRPRRRLREPRHPGSASAKCDCMEIEHDATYSSPSRRVTEILWPDVEPQATVNGRRASQPGCRLRARFRTADLHRRRSGGPDRRSGLARRVSKRLRTVDKAVRVWTQPAHRLIGSSADHLCKPLHRVGRLPYSRSVRTGTHRHRTLERSWLRTSRPHLWMLASGQPRPPGPPAEQASRRDSCRPCTRAAADGEPRSGERHNPLAANTSRSAGHGHTSEPAVTKG